MDEFELSVALLTPVSDLVQGDPGAKFEASFARAGNDSLYVDDPGITGSLNQNIDFLFGDLFDNSTEEYEIILNIQNTAQGGNPFLILDRSIPSVGADRFVLGDKTQPYYTSPSKDTLSTTNILGLNEFAVLYDFSPTQDTIQLNGKREDYRLVEVNGLQVQGVAQPVSGEAIFSLQQGLPDLVGFVISTDAVDLNLTDKYFQFVGSKPNAKPAKRKIGQLGTTGIDLSLGAATDPSGNVYITGSTTGPLQGNNQGFSDAWSAKYNSSGNLLSGKQIGSSGGDQAYAVATDNAGNYYLAGATGGNLFSSKQSGGQDAWVAKYDSSGNQLWGKQIGTSVTGGISNSAFGLDVDAAGNVFLSGLAIKENQRKDIFNFNAQDDPWVIKFDSSGNQQSFTQIKDPKASFPFDITPFFDESYDLAVDKNGNAYTVGWTQGLVKESDPSRPLLKYDAWISKVNPAGQVEWVQQFGSTNEGLEFAWGVDTDSKGDIYVTGWTTGDIGTKDKKFKNSESYDIWLSKFSPDGTKQWTKQMGSKGDDGMFLSDLHIDAQDNIFMTGYTRDKLGKGQKDAASNAWVARFDTAGNNKWIQQFGSKDNLDYGTAVSADNAGKLYVTGFTDGSLGTNNTGANTTAVDAWLAQLDVDKGRLQRFTGDAKDVISIADPGTISTTDISNVFVTDEALPSGDNIINPAEGISTSNSTLNYGQIESSLGSIFDPSSQNSFPAALTAAVNAGTVVI